MPIYEYQCRKCKKISSFLLLRATEEVEPFCRTCGNKDMERIISRVGVIKGEEKRMESLFDPSRLSGLDENDPRSIERFMKRMGRELGDELGEDFRQSMEEAMETQDVGGPNPDGEDM